MLSLKLVGTDQVNVPSFDVRVSRVWTLELDLLPGSHAYRFLVDGIYRKDPLSKDIVLDRFDNEYTQIKIPYMD